MDEELSLVPPPETILGFNLELPEHSLKTAVVFSLLSVWVLVGLFQYLNRYTRRRYFSIWTAGWLFYALFLTIRGSSERFQAIPMVLFLENCCIATAAMLMFWGSFTFMELKTRQRLIGTAIVFVSVWSYFAAFQFPNELWIQIPAFALLGSASLFTALAFFRQTQQARFLGTGLLTFGFGLWALYLILHPFLQASEISVSAGFLIATVLQLFIATSMIILVLEETKSALRQREAEVETEKSKATFFETTAASRLDRYLQLFQTASDAILIVDAYSLEILDANRAAHGMFKAANQPPGGKKLGDVIQGHLPFQKAPDWLAHLCASGEAILNLPGKQSKRVSIHGGAIKYEGRDAWQLFLTELSEREKAQAQVRQAEKLAALSQMISGVAHELNNPLAAIQGYADLLMMDTNLAGAARPGIQHIATESARAVKLLKNFLSFAQVDSSERERISLNVLVQSLAESRRAELSALGCEVDLRLAPENPEVVGVGDHLRQALNQLITNAVEAMDDQKREKRISISTTVNEDQAVLKVEDSGPGIPAEIAARIFEPFFTTKPQGQGTGLGLSVAHGLISQHHGELTFEPRPTHGAAFVVKLPLAKAGQIQEEPLTPAKTAGARILIVDDEEALAGLLQEMLALSGQEAEVSSDPREALQKLTAKEFDIVISDFRMPAMNGADFFEAAVKIDPRYGRRFAFITGDAVHEAARDFFADHEIPKLLKPFQLVDVERLIARILNGNAQTNGGGHGPGSSTA